MIEFGLYIQGNKPKMETVLESHWMYLWNTIPGEGLCGERALKLKVEGASHKEKWEQRILGAWSRLVDRIVGWKASLPCDRVSLSTKVNLWHSHAENGRITYFGQWNGLQDFNHVGLIFLPLAMKATWLAAVVQERYAIYGRGLIPAPSS